MRRCTPIIPTRTASTTTSHEHWTSRSRRRPVSEDDPPLRSDRTSSTGGSHAFELPRVWRERHSRPSIHKESEDAGLFHRRHQATAGPMAEQVALQLRREAHCRRACRPAQAAHRRNAVHGERNRAFVPPLPWRQPACLPDLRRSRPSRLNSRRPNSETAPPLVPASIPCHLRFAARARCAW